MSAVDTEQELNDRFKQWNPMKEAYMDSQFNRYTSGPGANLGPSVSLRKNELQNRKNYLVFKHIPPGLNMKVLRNMCARHGRVTDIRNSNKNDYYFVEFATLADLEAVYRALSMNTYGFQVLIGKDKSEEKTNKNLFMGSHESNPQNENKLSGFDVVSNVIDVQNRSYRPSERNPPRPHIQQKPIVSAAEYATVDSLLQRNDPQRHYLIENDAHELERAGLQQAHTALINNNKCKYRTGRAFIDMPEKTQQFIAAKQAESNGTVDEFMRNYLHCQKTLQTLKGLAKCEECERLCDFVCSRCSIYYCSVNCQTKAWPKHRYVCGKPKHLQIKPPSGNKEMESGFSVPTNSSTNHNCSASTDSTNSCNQREFLQKINNCSSITTSNYPKPEINMPRSGSLVTLTSISKTNVIFVRSKTPEDNLEFFKVVSEIQAAAKDLKKLQCPPKCGQIVVAIFERQYSRAMVLNANSLERIKLVFIDYGNLDVQALSDLYEAPLRYAFLPRLAIPVILKDVPDSCMTSEIREFMYSYLNGIDLELHYNPADLINEKGVYQVELIDESTNKSLNKMISTLCKPVEPTDLEEVCFRNYLKQQMLPTEENTELVVMDNSLLITGCISCTSKKYALEIQQFQRDVQRYGESSKEQSYAPRVDELCIAKYSADQKWYRGRCLDLVGDGHPTIVFFDYGNIAYVNIKDIRRYPTQFTYPIYTADCEIEGLPEQCNASLVSLLEELIPNGGTISCERVRAHEQYNFYSLALPNVIDKLQEAGLLDKPVKVQIKN